MRKITLVLVTLLSIHFTKGQTPLSAGDIVITGFNAHNTEQFTFVLLKNISTGTQINFTDNGWENSGKFRDTEGTITWEADTNLSCGTEITISDTDKTNISVNKGSASKVGSFNLNKDGDQIIAYQGTETNPNFLYALNFNSAVWTEASSSNTSALPTSLIDGITAVAVGNAYGGTYQCSSGINEGQSLILISVSNSDNWHTSNTTYAPIGGCSYTCSPCSSTAIWSNGAWSNGTGPDQNTEAIIADDYNTTNGGDQTSFSACSLAIAPGATLTVGSHSYIEVENDVTVYGDIYVETYGNFVQNNNNGTFTLVEDGKAQVFKETPPKAEWYHYTYWSSPVENQLIEEAFPDVDGDRRFWYDATNLNDPDGDGIDDNGDDWQYALAGTVMQPGVGYAITEPRSHISGNTGSATFEGKFNTGNIAVNIYYDSANQETWNLIGNPYPSAIDLEDFYTANSSIIGGAFYFWSQSSPPDSANPGNQQLNFSQDDYAVFAVGTGGTQANAGSDIPNDFIASGQGFFVDGIATGTATFTNALRMADDSSNDQFFRSSEKSKQTTTDNPLENRLWVNLSSDNGVFNQILVGYVEGATNNDDGGAYDAKKIISEDYPAALYSTIEGSNKKYVIQGKNITSIDQNEIIKLGFKTTINVATRYTLSVAKIEGDFLNSHSIYIKDNLLGQIHNLSDSDYTFTSETGEFNNRFEIVFNANALSTNATSATSSQLQITSIGNGMVQFSAPNALNIKSIDIFDMLGRKLYHFKGQRNVETVNFSKLKNNVYIARVELSNGSVISKKAAIR